MNDTYFSPLLMLKNCPAEESVSEYARERGWQYAARSAGNPHTFEPAEVVWSADSALRVHYGENHFTGYCYVQVSGEQPGQVQSLSGRLLQDLDVYTFEELLQAVDDAHNESMLGATLTLLAMGAPAVDQRVLQRLKRGFSHPSEKLRELVVWSMSLNPRAEFRPLLRSAAEEDPSPSLRDKAQRMLASYDSAGVEQA
ncbi:hypothetical protein JOF41_002715 [Saccharothrix coeruleofusca]|uniref:hypothetical protein n=1 Tax=Saccharothrix coeruleofusca TaxID=33919 RepID=UPI001AE5FE17|nr:hypothetical protein [Saccharothrix coeruleofusca]MBP2336537.1 hypothetical protein [Saccharothrix coeruleofusca]